MILQSKLVALLNEVLNQNAKLRKGGNEASYFCCFCHHYKRKLEVNLLTGQWSCWVCHARGSYLGSLLSKVKAPKRYREQLFTLTKDVRLQRRSRNTSEEQILELPPEFKPMTQASNSICYKHAMMYLKQRGIGLDDICRYNIGYCETGEYADRVLVPSYDAEGKLNYFSARSIYPNTFEKYKNAPWCKDVVGFELFINWDDPVTVVEGAFDAIAARKNATPLFGTTLPRMLLWKLVIHRTKRVNLVLDNDALKQAIEAIELFKTIGDKVNGIEVHRVKLPEKDPSELGFEKTDTLITGSRPYEFQDLIGDKLKAALCR